MLNSCLCKFKKCCQSPVVLLLKIARICQMVYRNPYYWLQFVRVVQTHGLKSAVTKVRLQFNLLEDSVDLQLHAIQYEITAKRKLPLFETPTVSVIIPAYNQWEYTYGCIASIMDNVHDITYEVVLADDNSDDETINAGVLFENLVIIRNKTNLGFLKNCNNAAKHARGKYLVFLNNDTQVLPNWLESLVDIMDIDASIGLVGSRLIYANGLLQEAGGIIWQDGSGWNYGRLDDANKPEYNYVKEVDYISGASIMLRKQLWDTIGGFDEQFAPAYCEDSDLCFSVRKHGYKVVYQPFSRVIHFEGISHGTALGEGIKQYQVINNQKLKNKWANELKLQAVGPEELFKARDRSHTKKTIVVIDHYVPMSDRDAGSKTMLNFLQTLVKLDFNVKFIGDNFAHLEPYTAILQKIGVEVLYGDEYARTWRRYLTKNAKNIDFVLLSRAHICLRYLKFIRKENLDFKVVYYGHDLGFKRLEQEHQLTQNKALLTEAKECMVREKYMYNNVDLSLTCSSDEKKFLSDFCNKPVVLVPPYFFPIIKNVNPCALRDGILFVGGFAHYPNEDAVVWFLENIYSFFADIGVPFRIVGSGIPDAILDYKNKCSTIEYYSGVSNEKLAELYSISRVVIVPLRIGAGVKGKVVESMAYGVPLVGTSIAYEGLPNLGLVNRCDSVELFHEELKTLLGNDANWQELSDMGLNYVKDNFSQEKMLSVFSDVFKSE